MKRFHVRDGYGIKLLQKNNIEVAVISGGDSLPLRKRLEVLGVKNFHLASNDKGLHCQQLFEKLGVSGKDTATIGDDLIDLPMFKECEFSFAVADAVESVKTSSSYVLKNKGGHGAFREMSDMILKAKGL